MLRLVAKLLASVACFILPLICTLLPFLFADGKYVVVRQSRQRFVLSRLMCLGGGIFFGTYLLHIGPDVRQILDQALLKPYHIDYPLSELLTGVGFFLVLFAETLVTRWHGASHSKSQADVISVKEVESKLVEHDVKNGKTQEKLEVPTVSAGFSDVKNPHQNHADLKDELNNEDKKQHSCSNGHLPVQVNGKSTDVVVPLEIAIFQAGGHSHDHLHGARSFALILAISFHRIFEGMSVGLQQTASSVGMLLLAVMCHEMVIAFSLGLQFVRSKLSMKRLVVTSGICSFIMPVGVIIGCVMSETTMDNSNQLTPGPMLIAIGVSQAVAVGTFIYVTFFEILSEELAAHDASLSKVIFVAIGFSLMAILDLVPEEQLQLQQGSPLPSSTVDLLLTTTAY